MTIKLMTFYASLIAMAISVGSCNNTDDNKARQWADTATAKADSVVQDAKQDVKAAEAKVERLVNNNPDSNFVVKAALDNNAEIRLLQSGLDNGTNKELKAHAKMMLTDHKKLAAGLTAYAARKNFVLMDGDNGKADGELATLSGKTKGADWDNEWVSALIDGHKNAISLFEKAKDDVKDDELKNMITSTLPTLHSHLDMMTKLQEKLGK